MKKIIIYAFLLGFTVGVKAEEEYLYLSYYNFYKVKDDIKEALKQVAENNAPRLIKDNIRIDAAKKFEELKLIYRDLDYKIDITHANQDTITLISIIRYRDSLGWIAWQFKVDFTVDVIQLYQAILEHEQIEPEILNKEQYYNFLNLYKKTN